MLTVIVVLILGSHLHVAGYTTIPLPWNVLDQSLLHDVIPIRLSVYMFLIAAVILAMWLAQPRAGGWGVAKWAVAAVSIAFLVPNVGGGIWRGKEVNPSFFTTHEYRRVLTRGESVLILPFGQLDNSMLWQADTDFWFRLAGGYINPVIPARLRTRPAVPRLVPQGQAGPAGAALLPRPSAYRRGDRRSRHASAVARGAGGARAQALLTRRRLVLPPMSDRGSSDVPGVAYRSDRWQ